MRSLIEISAGQFEDKKKEKYFLLDFYSDECPNCDRLRPVLEQLNDELGDKILFAKIFRQQNRAFAESLDILSSPTVLFFAGGELKFRMSGYVSKEKLRSEIIHHVPGI